MIWVWNIAVIFGCAYVVFGLGYSGWWFALAVMLLMSEDSPKNTKSP